MAVPKKERAEAVERLRAAMPPGSTVYTQLQHVSRSGMMRHISVRTSLEGLHDWDVAAAVGYSLAPREGIKVSGAGMDMGFSLVYNLSRTLYPNGFGCIGEHCPSNDHSNERVANYTPAIGVKLRCPSCLDVPGRDGLGRTCKTCGGSGQVEGKHDATHIHKDGGSALKQRWL